MLLLCPPNPSSQPLRFQRETKTTRFWGLSRPRPTFFLLIGSLALCTSSFGIHLHLSGCLPQRHFRISGVSILRVRPPPRALPRAWSDHQRGRSGGAGWPSEREGSLPRRRTARRLGSENPGPASESSARRGRNSSFRARSAAHPEVAPHGRCAASGGGCQVPGGGGDATVLLGVSVSRGRKEGGSRPGSARRCMRPAPGPRASGAAGLAKGLPWLKASPPPFSSHRRHRLSSGHCFLLPLLAGRVEGSCSNEEGVAVEPTWVFSVSGRRRVPLWWWWWWEGWALAFWPLQPFLRNAFFPQELHHRLNSLLFPSLYLLSASDFVTPVYLKDAGVVCDSHFNELWDQVTSRT